MSSLCKVEEIVHRVMDDTAKQRMQLRLEKLKARLERIGRDNEAGSTGQSPKRLFLVPERGVA